MNLNNPHIRKFLLKIFENPVNKIENPHETNLIWLTEKKSICSDEINVTVKFLENKINECYFFGQSCILATVATDLLLTEIRFKERKQAKKILKNFYLMMMKRKYDEKLLNNTRLMIFTKLPNINRRVDCVLIGYKAIWRWLNS